MLRIVFLSSVLGTLYLSGASAQCGIIEHPASQNVSLGDMVVLQCLTDLENDIIVTDWLFGEDDASVDRSKYELSQDDGTLIINSFDSSYAGLYRCVVTNKANQRCVSKAAKLLYYNAQSSFQIHPQDYVAFQSHGDFPAAFNCTYDDSECSIAPTIVWELNGKELPQDNSANYSIFSYKYTSFLQIHDLSPLRGQISTVRCVVHGESVNSVYSETATLNVTVGTAPSDQPIFSTVPIPLMYLSKGDTVIAGCSVTVVDSIPLAWAFEDNTAILYAGFDEIPPTIPVSLYGHTNLLLNSSAEYDFHNKTFLCQILLSSGHQYITAPVTFFVYDSPIITSISTADNEFNETRGDAIAFDVNVNKNTPARVKWFFDAARLRSSADRRIEIKNENSEEFEVEKVWTQDLDASLLINNITCDDVGYLQVEISNPVKTVLLTYKLNVDGCLLPEPEPTKTIGPEPTESIGPTPTESIGSAPIGPSAQDDDDGDGFPWWIILIIILLLIILLLLLLLCCWCWRRRYVVYEAEKLENRYHKDYEVIRSGGSPVDATV